MPKATFLSSIARNRRPFLFGLAAVVLAVGVLGRGSIARLFWRPPTPEEFFAANRGLERPAPKLIPTEPKRNGDEPLASDYRFAGGRAYPVEFTRTMNVVQKDKGFFASRLEGTVTFHVLKVDPKGADLGWLPSR